MIRFDRVFKRYPNGREALADLTLEIASGEMLFLTGHSGAGKSTLLRLVALMERPTRGQLFVNHQNVAGISRRRIPSRIPRSATPSCSAGQIVFDLPVT